jgi:hypothetical protein
MDFKHTATKQKVNYDRNFYTWGIGKKQKTTYQVLYDAGCDEPLMNVHTDGFMNIFVC